MSIKYFIHKERRWIELDVASGKLNGIREKPKFFYVRRGTLQLACTSSVLRGLKALACSTRGSVKTGLSLIRKRKHKKSSKKYKALKEQHHCCVCTHKENRAAEVQTDLKITIQDHVNKNTQNEQKSTENVPFVTKDLNGQNDPIKTVSQNIDIQKEITQIESNVDKVDLIVNKLDTNVNKVDKIVNKLDTKVNELDTKVNKVDTKVNKVDTIVNKVFTKVNKVDEKVNNLYIDSETSSGTATPCKELFIETDDLTFIKRVLKSKTLIKDFNEKEFGNDTNYTTNVLYKLNPTVRVKKSKNIDGLAYKWFEDKKKIGLREFAAKLGLKHITDVVDVDVDNTRYKTRQSFIKKNDLNNRDIEKIMDKLDKKESYSTTDSSTSEDKFLEDRPSKTSKRKRSSSSDSVFSSDHKIEPKEVKKNVPTTVLTQKKSNNKRKKQSSESSDSENNTNKTKKTAIVTKEKETPKKGKKEISSESSDSENNTNKTKKTAIVTKEKETPKKGKKEISSESSDSENNTNKTKKTAIVTKEKHTPKKRKDQISSESSDSENNTNKTKKTAIVTKEKETPKKQNKENANKPENNYQKKKMRPRTSLVWNNANTGYTNIEDHAIISWIVSNGRENKVNGNSLWMQLQTVYSNITGHARSWHSLRNRYLRYILPSLETFQLEPSVKSRLRAAAIKGELKLSRKKNLNRRNSIHKVSPVKSAFNRVVKEKEKDREDEEKSDGDDPPVPLKKVLRSSLSTPTYSQLTRAFTDNKEARLSSSSVQSLMNKSPVLPSASKTRKLFNPKAI